MGSQARQYHTQQIHYLTRAISEADEGAGALTIGVVPAGALIYDAGVVVTTAFNGTSPVFIMGPSGDTDGWATAVAIATTGRKVADELAGSDDLYSTSEVTCTITVSATGNDSTAGAGFAYVAYMPLTNG
jgi:hypothetical protein